MTLRYVAAAGIIALASATMAKADAVQANSYRSGDYLVLDLRKAVLSPKPLGPAAQFEAYPIAARADTKNEMDAAADKPAQQAVVPVAKPPRNIAARAKPPARTRVARPRSNPLDANAADTRIQTWPCRSGGICNWQR